MFMPRINPGSYSFLGVQAEHHLVKDTWLSRVYQYDWPGFLNSLVYSKVILPVLLTKPF